MPSQSILERPLPNNLDAERSVLGAVILDNNALNAAIENLKPEDFFLDQHRRVFTQMIALGEAQQAIDLITLTEELHRRGDLEAAQKQAAVVNGVSLRFTRKTGENDQLFGSVTSGDIADALAAQGFKIDKRQIQLRESIKALGEYPVTVKIFRDVTAEVKAHVEKEA